MPATPAATRAQGVVVDYISRDTLDCRRANMRLTTLAGNSQNKFPLNPKNKTGFRSVPDCGGELPYVVQITLGAAIRQLRRYAIIPETAVAAQQARGELNLWFQPSAQRA